MFNLGEKVRIDTYDKELKIFAHIIKKKTIKDEVAYIVTFRNGEVGTFFESELLKIQ